MVNDLYPHDSWIVRQLGSHRQTDEFHFLLRNYMFLKFELHINQWLKKDKIVFYNETVMFFYVYILALSMFPENSF